MTTKVKTAISTAVSAAGNGANYFLSVVALAYGVANHFWGFELPDQLLALGFVVVDATRARVAKLMRKKRSVEVTKTTTTTTTSPDPK